MTPDIRKQIREAIETAYAKLTTDDAGWSERAGFIAGAEFGYGLASEEKTNDKMRFVPETDRGPANGPNVSAPTEGMAMLGVHDEACEKQRDQLINRVIDLRIAADDMARALESVIQNPTVDSGGSFDHDNNWTRWAKRFASEKLTNYRKLFPKGE